MKNTKGENENCMEELRETYKLAIEGRNFHYNNFNKWMTFFYVAVAAIFISFYSSNLNGEFQIILLILGFIVSILWYLSCKGYYFWIKNWAYQLKRFEDQFPESLRLYSSFSEVVQKKNNNLLRPLESANISTSKTTLLFSFIISIAWGYFLIHTLVLSLLPCTIWSSSLISVATSILLTYLITLILGCILRSNLNEHKIVKT